MKLISLAVIALIAALFMTGCGGSGDTPANAEPQDAAGVESAAPRKAAGGTRAGSGSGTRSESSPSQEAAAGDTPAGAEATDAEAAAPPETATETPAIAEPVAPKPSARPAGRVFTSPDGMRFVSFDARGSGVDFWIGAYEVTQAQYEAVMGSNPSRYLGDRRPVEYVSWLDAVEFANRMSDRDGLERCYDDTGESIKREVTSCEGYRLPTDREWLNAAAGLVSESTDREVLHSIGWIETNALGKHHEIGTKQGTEAGLFDLVGNVGEWVHEGTVRGGGWNTPPDAAKGPDDLRLPRTKKEPTVGIRLARSLF